jgi:hypothetical protein
VAAILAAIDIYDSWRARWMVCGALRPAVVLPGAVSRRARIGRVSCRITPDSRLSGDLHRRCAYASYILIYDTAYGLGVKFCISLV